MSSKDYVLRRIAAFSRRAYSLAQAAAELRDTTTPMEFRLYGDTLQQIADGALETYFVALEAMRNAGYNKI